MEDNQGKSKCSCIRCGKLIKNLDWHIKTCKKAIEDVDFVVCKICNKKMLVLYVHCGKHGLSPEEYQTIHGRIMCEEAEKRISERNKKTAKKANYRNKLKKEDRLDELKIFNKKMGKTVAKTVLESPKLRKIRSQTLARLNKTDQFRKKASETAIRTSSDPEIIKKRTQQLLNWIKKNPEKIQESLLKLHLFQTSRPEKILYEFCIKNFPNLKFKSNQQLKNKKFVFNKTLRKQLDIFSSKEKIIIEFDGVFHFKNIKKWNQLKNVQKKDKILNSLHHEFMIIRISNDQFSYKKSTYGFKNECLEQLKQLLQSPQAGLFLIGEMYAKN